MATADEKQRTALDLLKSLKTNIREKSKIPAEILGRRYHQLKDKFRRQMIEDMRSEIRYEYPAIKVKIEEHIYHVKDWSYSGFRIQDFDGFYDENFDLTLIYNGRDCTAKGQVVWADVENRQCSIAYTVMNKNTKKFIGQLILEAHNTFKK